MGKIPGTQTASQLKANPPLSYKAGKVSLCKLGVTYLLTHIGVISFLLNITPSIGS